MKWLPGLLLALLAWPAFAQATDIRVPAGLQGDGIDRAMPELAREVIAVYRDEDRARYLDTLFRLQLAAGQHAQALQSIDAIRGLRSDPPTQPPVFLQYEIHARAKLLQATHNVAFAQAWRQSFAERFGGLDDRVALRAEFSFGGSLPRWRGSLDDALGKLEGKRRVPLAEAVALVRAWQVHDAYAAFMPLFDAALKADDARRYAIDRDVLVRTPDGAGISTIIVRPAKAPPLPALLSFTIYANDDWAWGDAKAMAAHGYAGVVSYARGKGRSTDAIVPFEHDRDHRGRLHELGNAREKRLVRDVTVMFREDFVGQLHHLRSANEKTRLFKSINHSTTMGFFHTIGFEEDERAFGRHGDVR